MIFLEIAMIVIGLAAVIYSVRISDNTGKVPKEDFDEPSLEDQEKERKQLQEMLDSFTRKAETVYDNLDERMSQVSNEKIMGISEYSDQVIGKIEKNHDEVVFLYDMMNEKQEEVKKLVHEIDSLRADLHDESAREYQKMREQGEQLDEMKKSIELDILELQSGHSRVHQENQQPASTGDGFMDEFSEANLEEDEFDKEYEAVLNDEDFEGLEDFDALAKEASFIPEPDIEEEDEEDDLDAASVYDAEIARIEEEEARAKMAPNVSEQYRPFSEQKEIVNHNDEILALYKKGRSVLDISKMLSLGQGEVKFVIDLYNAR
ncbi:hypothetical protein D7V86_03565 [bacterium D16-51]|nr:hypothetical protein D7V96_00355 [bacterium D16-59]RKI61883.1 hypothetical protein D7V86_03565 [bacterium D16-51]